jgi:hypothetical protein
MVCGAREGAWVGLSPTATAFDDVVSLVEAVIWPLVALLILFALRPFLPDLVRGLSRRVTRISWASVSLEFAVAREVRPEIWGSLQALRDPARSELRPPDSGQALFLLIRAGERADSATFDLGVGDRWLTSRLYIFAVVLSEVLGIRCMVFVQTREGVPRRFIGLASPQAVRRALERRYGWLERALLSSQLNFYSYSTESLDRFTKYVEKEVDDDSLTAPGLEPTMRPLVAEMLTDVDLTDAQTAERVANLYLRSPLIAHEVDAVAPEEKGWVRLGAGAEEGKIREEHALWIKEADQLNQILGDALTFPVLLENPGGSVKDLERQAVLVDDGEFVAILDADGRFKRLLNRRAIIERVGKQVAQEGLDAS